MSTQINSQILRTISLVLIYVFFHIFVSPSHAQPMNMMVDGLIYNPANKHYYKLTEKMSWTQAEEHAVQWGGHLVTINDREEEQWLRSQFGQNERFWIGFNDINAEGNWVWISGEPVTYTNWSQGEPNNEGTHGEVEHAAIMNWSYGVAWNDNSIYNGYRGIIEVSSAVFFLDNDDHSRQVSGAAADGASQVIIKVIGLPDDVVDPSQVVVTIPDDGGDLLDPATIKDGVFMQTWKAPEDFGGDNPNPDKGRRPIDFQISIPELNEKVPEFYLYKPPVVLIHGIWSSHKIWNALVDKLAQAGYWTVPIDYCNSCHFKDNIRTVGNQIKTIIRTARDHGFDEPIVIKKADVIAHSMGGILACLYIVSGDYENDINRLITIGTPFSGSQFANYSLDLLLKRVPSECRLDWITLIDLGINFFGGGSLFGGAAEDLQVGSAAINQFIDRLRSFDFPVPVYAITCDGDDNTPGLGLDFAYRALGIMDLLFNNFGQYFGIGNVENKMFGTNNTDFVVSFDSQRGESSRYVTKNVIDHMSETNDNDVMIQVNDLLASPISSFSKEGFKPKFLSCVVPPVEPVSIIQISPQIGEIDSLYSMLQANAADFITLVSPVDGSIYMPGEKIHVEAICQGAPESVLFVTPFGWYEDKIAPYEYDFTISWDFVGEFIIAIAVLDDTGLIDYKSVNLYSEPLENLIRITVGPLNTIVLNSGEDFTLYVNGLYQDEMVRDITSLSTTHYASSDPKVVEITSKGLIKARFPGRAVVTIENSGVSTDIDIVVKMVKGVHIGGVEIGTEWDYENPDDPNDTEYTFSFEIITDESVQNMVIFTPAGGLCVIPRIPEEEIDVPGGSIETGWEYDADISAYQWYYEAIFDNPNDLNDAGDGNYTIVVQYNDGQIDLKNIWFGIPDTNEPIPQPIKEPIFTSFINGDILTSPASFKWESCIDPNINIVLVSLENEDTDEEMNYILDGNSTGFEEPLPLSCGQWEAELSYIFYYQTETVEGMEVFCCKSSESDYRFFVP